MIEDSIKQLERIKAEALEAKEKGSYHLFLKEIKEYHPFKQGDRLIATPTDNVINRMNKEIGRLRKRIE